MSPRHAVTNVRGQYTWHVCTSLVGAFVWFEIWHWSALGSCDARSLSFFFVNSSPDAKTVPEMSASNRGIA